MRVASLYVDVDDPQAEGLEVKRLLERLSHCPPRRGAHRSDMAMEARPRVRFAVSCTPSCPESVDVLVDMRRAEFRGSRSLTRPNEPGTAPGIHAQEPGPSGTILFRVHQYG